MAKLCIYLPPFASDYTGVCSALFDLDCLVAVNDASCCTGHYVYYDEPRWTKRRRPTFCTQLREIDAVLGNDDKVVQCVLEVSAQVDTEIIALVGTPVPALIGMDMPGAAAEIEGLCGKPVMGFNTNGTLYYDRGISMAGKALIRRFTRPAGAKKGRLNILGMTPLDYGDAGNDTDMAALLEECGFTVNAAAFMGSTIDDFRRLAEAERNIAVSAAGLAMAKDLHSRFGTPYTPLAPMGRQYAAAALSGAAPSRPGPSGGGAALILADQVMGNSLRAALRLKGCKARISVASFFGWDPAIAEEGDLALGSEKELVFLLRAAHYDHVLADPLFFDLPELKACRRHELVHPAVSGKLRWQDTPRYLSGEFEARLSALSEELNHAGC